MRGKETVRVVLQVWFPRPHSIPSPSPPVLISPGPYLCSVRKLIACCARNPHQASLPQAIMSVSSFAKQQMQFKCEGCR